MSVESRNQVICALADVPDPGTYEFAIGEGDWPLRGFIVRQGTRLRAYVNRCPHAGHMLNLRPNRFFAPQNDLLLCSSHGALFDPQSGECIAGPCFGKALQPLELQLAEDWVVIRYRGGQQEKDFR